MAEKEPTHEERLKELRERLYSRGAPPPQRERRELPDELLPVSHTWERPAVVPTLSVEPPVSADAPPPLLPMKRKKRSYRTTLIVAGLVFFVMALVLSGSFLLFGKNMISGDNISVEIVDPPFAIGGGEELSFQVTIANQNAVSIESATLIVEYPNGTQSADEEGKELFRERKPLALIKQGEVVNVPLRARVFGKENDEKTVLVSVEYRVQGSNAVFVKDAAPFNFKISSSPVVLSIENLTKSPSGQDIELKATISSNAPSEISDLLIKLESPVGFDYTDSTPAPLSGQDTWNVSNLKPGEKKTVTIRGALTGNQDEKKIFKFSVGVPNERDRFSLASIFTSQTEEITIEEPFLNLKVLVNGTESDSPVIPPGDTVNVSVVFTNTLSSTLYDGKISVDLSGNGIDKDKVDSSDGYYDSATNIISWSPQDVKSLKTITPGDASTVSFTFTPSKGGSAERTPQVSMKVHAEGNRISESNVSQRLTGTATKVIKVESVAALTSETLYSTGGFTNTGVVPPKVEAVTTYTMHLEIVNGSNAVSNGTVTAVLPAYVTWLNITTSAQTFTYNPQSREVSWKVGDLRAGEKRDASFQISVRPSAQQLGQAITLLNTQRFKATDRFTETTIRTEAPALTTLMKTDPEYKDTPGEVVKQ